MHPMYKFSALPFLTARRPAAVLTAEQFTQRHLREAPAANKRKLPAAMPHGVFDGRTADTLRRFSGLVQLDVDAKHNSTVPVGAWPEIARTFASMSPHAVLAQVSASGAGFWALVAVEIEPGAYDGDPVASHRARVDAVLDHMDAELHALCDAMNLPDPLALDRPVSYNLVALRFPGVGPAYFGAAAVLAAVSTASGNGCQVAAQ